PGEDAFSRRLNVPPGTTIAEILTELGVPDNLPTIFLVNGSPAQPGRVLTSGDVLSLLPPAGGG
ncbi:MAG: MoaD/ThiS family protein, partial [Deltaproteobacteria bacterium]|nr:MoaD/ThiS family protein [Deltaproteobacteria bacterium]